MQNTLRLLHIAGVVVRHSLAHLLGCQPFLARRFAALSLSGPVRLRTAIEEIGGTFIKFGQMLALQPDILPFEYCRALADLLDRVAPFGYEQVETTLVEELGKGPDELFDSFEPIPLATASVGQVHVAYLDGEKVAVKVQRPTVRTDFAGDIRLMTASIALIKRLRLRTLAWMVEPMSEFVAWTREELDFTHEARYMAQLNLNAADSRSEDVPSVYWRYTTQRVLVAEFFDGTTVLDYLRAIEGDDELTPQRLRAGGFEPNQFARNIIDNFLGGVFRHGLFHADLHPANLMIMDRNAVGYVDFGISGVLSHYSRQKLVAMTLAYTRADVEGMCSAFFKVSAMDDSSDPGRFRAELERFGEEWYEIEGTRHRLRKNFTLVMLDMLRLSRRTGIWPERDVIKYIRSAIAIDGLITRFAPEFDVGGYLEIVCDRYLKWEARRSLLSYDSLIEWSDAGGRLLEDGPARAAAALDRLSRGEMKVRATAAESAAPRLRALCLAAVAIGLSLPLSAAPAELGLNLFTSQAALAVLAVLLLGRQLLRLL
jgi:ubiquinone biosynthesis protein